MVVKKNFAIVAILLCITASFAFIHSLAQKPGAIDPESFGKAGSILKPVFPEYTFSPEELGSRLFGKGYLSDSQYKVLLERGFTDEEIYNLVDHLDYYSLQTQIAMYGAWLLISILLLIQLRRIR